MVGQQGEELYIQKALKILDAAENQLKKDIREKKTKLSLDEQSYNFGQIETNRGVVSFISTKCYAAQMKYQEAIDRYKKAIVLYDAGKCIEGKASTLQNWAICLDAQKKYNEALRYGKQAELIYKEMGIFSKQASILLENGVRLGDLVSDFQKI